MKKLNLRMFDDVGDGNSPIIRNMVADYLEVNGKYYLMGVGFKEINESPGAKSESVVYVNQKGAYYSVDSYDTKFSFDMHLVPAEIPIMAIYNVGRNHLTGDAAVFNFCRVEVFNTIGTPTAEIAESTAREFSMSVEVTDFSGAGGERVSVKGNLNARGDPKLGKFDTVGMTFTEGDFKGRFDPPDVAAG